MENRATTVTAIGETMIVLQKVERFLAAVLMHMASADEAGAKLEKALLRDRETLGRMLDHFRERVEIPADFADDLDILLRDRNTFIHNLFMEPWFDLNSPEGCARLNEFMRNIREKARTSTKVMMASLSAKELDGQCTQEAHAYVARVFKRIEETSHPDVQSRVDEQYIERVRSDAQANFAVKRREA